MATNYDDSYRLGIKKEVNGERRYFTYDGSVLLGEITFDISGQVKDERYYIFVPRSYYPLEMVILENNEWKPYAYHNDHLMTPLRLTDENQDIAWSGEYKAFGEVNISIEDVTNNLRFQGQYSDDENKFYYNHSRFYLAFCGRYNAFDQIFNNYNNYIYVINNPLLYVDPFGLITCTKSRINKELLKIDQDYREFINRKQQELISASFQIFIFYISFGRRGEVCADLAREFADIINFNKYYKCCWAEAKFRWFYKVGAMNTFTIIYCRECNKGKKQMRRYNPFGELGYIKK